MRVPRPLAAICVRALEVEPSKRYQTVTALAEDVARYRDNRKVHAHRDPRSSGWFGLGGPIARRSCWCWPTSSCGPP